MIPDIDTSHDQPDDVNAAERELIRAAGLILMRRAAAPAAPRRRPSRPPWSIRKWFVGIGVAAAITPLVVGTVAGQTAALRDLMVAEPPGNGHNDTVAASPPAARPSPTAAPMAVAGSGVPARTAAPVRTIAPRRTSAPIGPAAPTRSVAPARTAAPAGFEDAEPSSTAVPTATSARPTPASTRPGPAAASPNPAAPASAPPPKGHPRPVAATPGVAGTRGTATLRCGDQRPGPRLTWNAGGRNRFHATLVAGPGGAVEATFSTGDGRLVRRIDLLRPNERLVVHLSIPVARWLQMTCASTAPRSGSSAPPAITVWGAAIE